MAGNLNENNIDEHDVSLEDIDAIAKAKGTTRAKVLQDTTRGTQSTQDDTHANQQGNTTTGHEHPHQDGFTPEYNSDQFQSNPVGRQDGYSETQGAGYGQSQNTTGQPSQDHYDPAHSGVRHAQNRPGTRPPTPGRETGTSWGEDQQMGTTTDTPDRKNPAD